MFRWCSYCQTFIGESKPFEDFSLTHGICKYCLKSVKNHSYQLTELTYDIQNFFQELKQQIIDANQIDKNWVLIESRKLKLIQLISWPG